MIIMVHIKMTSSLVSHEKKGGNIRAVQTSLKLSPVTQLSYLPPSSASRRTSPHTRYNGTACPSRVNKRYAHACVCSACSSVRTACRTGHTRRAFHPCVCACGSANTKGKNNSSFFFFLIVSKTLVLFSL